MREGERHTDRPDQHKQHTTDGKTNTDRHTDVNINRQGKADNKQIERETDR